jgi:AcrR family transcriptional regulator
MNNDTEQYRNKNSQRKRGRPRSPEHDVAILEAALRLMQRDGYARLSMDVVAAEAGTTKAAIYRRHASKAELATAALAFLRDQRPPPATDDARADLVEELRRFRRGVERPHGMAMLGTVLAEESHVPELVAAFRRDVVLPRRQRLREILSRATLREGLDPETAISMAVGSYYAEYLATGRPGKDWSERLAATLLTPRE